MLLDKNNPTTEALNTLREKLREMLQFAHSDLDFGIFRILNLKSDEVNQFINEKLTTIVDKALTDVAETLHETQLTQVKDYVNEYGGKRIKECLENVVKEAQTLIEFLQSEDKEELTTPLKTDPDKLKAQLAFKVYNHIHSFFEGYYRDGDFGYNDRSTAQYKVNYPDETDYNGSDVLFHWKCRDSYYVKTATGFNSVAFEVEGKRIEYRLEGKASSAVSQNSNQDEFKHYQFDRIDPPKEDDAEQTWRVILHLAETSTPKVDIYSQMNDQIFGETDDVSIYLHERAKKNEEQGKPIFKDLANTYDKVRDGRLQGIKALHVSLEKYAEKLATHLDFKELGKNKTERQAKLEISPKVQRFHTFDKNLNTFFVGMDSDYFIHKDLDKFLKTEQRRYIQNTILGDLDTLLNLNPDNPAFAIATAFRNVTDEVIALLVAVETFQKQLFLMKKKVVSTDYLISIGKIAEVTTNDTDLREAIFTKILENEAQLDDWRDTFGVDIKEQPPLFIEECRTLPLDTRHFRKDESFIDSLLSLFDDLEEQINGVLLNSENFQALNLITDKYCEKIKCIYIDPPYNTGSDDFVYKDKFRHSSWLTFITDRIEASHKLLTPKGVIFISIDDNEVHQLRIVMNEIFSPDNFLTQFVWNKKNVVQNDAKFASVNHEYITCYRKIDHLQRFNLLPRTEKANQRYKNPDDDPRGPWQSVALQAKSGTQENVYTVTFPNGVTWTPPSGTYPKFPKEGLLSLYEEGCLYFGKKGKNVPRLKKYLSDVMQGMVLNSILKANDVGSTQAATETLKNILGNNVFNSPKAIRLIQKFLLISTGPNDTVLDYFAGSGTTGQAVLNLNITDNGNRKFILVEMGDYFESTLKERIRRVMFSENWKDGKPDENKKIDGSVGIVKYQRLEQYEDVLNNLTTQTPAESSKTDFPVKYLYRPEEQEIRLKMDMCNPFFNRITYGKDSTEGYVDVLETYCYLKGLPIQRRLRFDFDDHVYRVVLSGKRVVVFRPVSDGMDDTAQLLEILGDERLEGVTQLDINHDAKKNDLKVSSALKKIHIITTSDFDSGYVWDPVET